MDRGGPGKRPKRSQKRSFSPKNWFFFKLVFDADDRIRPAAAPASLASLFALPSGDFLSSGWLPAGFRPASGRLSGQRKKESGRNSHAFTEFGVFVVCKRRFQPNSCVFAPAPALPLFPFLPSQARPGEARSALLFCFPLLLSAFASRFCFPLLLFAQRAQRMQESGAQGVRGSRMSSGWAQPVARRAKICAFVSEAQPDSIVSRLRSRPAPAGFGDVHAAPKTPHIRVYWRHGSV